MPVLNVLLMLSSRQPPNPKEEIAHHANACAGGEPAVYLATTRVLTDLVPGESAVAFYGDSRLENEFLGVGSFEGYLPISSLRAAELVKSHPLYSTEGVPSGLRGFVILSRVRKPKRGETLAYLGGRLRAGKKRGEPLSEGNIPAGPARTAVYFWTDAPIFKE